MRKGTNETDLDLARSVSRNHNLQPASIGRSSYPRKVFRWLEWDSCVHDTTYDESLGKACGWAYWGFFFDNSTASGGAKPVGADSITVAPTLYPGFDPNYYGLTLLLQNGQ